MYENLKEVKKDSEEIFDGVILHLFKDTVILPNGQSATREVIRHNGAAAVVPINKNGEVLIEKQFRYPFDCVMTEIPAGKLDKGEEPETGARRELEHNRLPHADQYRPQGVSHLWRQRRKDSEDRSTQGDEGGLAQCGCVACP